MDFEQLKVWKVGASEFSGPDKLKVKQINLQNSVNGLVFKKY